MQRKWRRDWERGRRNPLKYLAKSILAPVAAAGLLLGSMTGAYANPTNGQITTGAGTISQNGTTMTINQTSDKLAINWDSFSIGTGETVQFMQPESSSIALNRVLGNDASSIYGSLTANGKVFLINPNGVLFAPGASVNVGSIVASTLNISDSDFLAGNYKFSGEGGSVVNQGTITAANGGYVALLGAEARNEGIIVAQQGTVALGAGQAVTLDIEGDGLLNLAVDEAALNAGAANHNLIQADGGLVIMAAQTAGDLAGTVVNNSGIIQAKSVSNVNGVIRLAGNGAVINSGTLDATGKNAGETGGSVTMLGNTVTLAEGSSLDASGAAGSGGITIKAVNDININGTVAAGSGNVVLRADSDANSAGTVNFGAGGHVTGNNVSIYYNPVSYTDAASQSTCASVWDGTAQVITTSNPYQGQVTGSLTAYMLVNTLADLQNMNTNLSGIYALGTDIDASATSSWNVDADGVAAGFVPIGTYTTPFSGIFEGDGHVITGLTMHGTLLPGGYSDGGLFGCASWATIRNVGLENVNITGDFIRVGALAGYLLYASSVSNCYSTGSVTDTDEANSMNSMVGGLIGQSAYSMFHPSGVGIADSYSTVAVTGSGTGTRAGGLIGYSERDPIINCFSTGAVTVTNTGTTNSPAYAGGLAGTLSTASSLSNSYSTGAVTLTNYNTSVSGYAGGLSGNCSTGAEINNSYSTGAVTLNNMVTPTKVGYAGGLVAGNGGTIDNSYTISSVTLNGSNIRAGGFTGLNGIGYISNCYSTGLITDNGSGNTVGGFAGYVTPAYASQITKAFWDNVTSRRSQGVGNTTVAGITGLTTDQMLDQDYLAERGFDFIKSWYMVDGYTRPFLQSEYSTTITNAHQLQLMAMGRDADYTLARDIELSGLFTDASGMWNTAYGFVPVGGSENKAFTGTLDGNGYAVRGLTINSPAFSALGLFGYTAGANIHDLGLTNVNISGGAANTYVGAVAGYNGAGGTMANVYTTGTVGGGQDTGGLTGYNAGEIATSYSMSAVSGASRVGGLTGTNAGSIINSYDDAYGVVTGVGALSQAGGLAGANSGTITTSYSAGAVSGGTAGGLAGDGTGGTIRDAVWDMDTSGQSQGVGNGAGTNSMAGLRTAEMGDSTNYPGSWDFSGIWSLSGARPLLQWELQGSNVITTLEQLRAISNNLNGMYILGADIDLTNWTPIGDSEATAFTGILKGNGYNLNGLTIHGSDASALGLFGYTQGAAISSVNLTKVDILAGTGNLYVGSLVGYSGAGTNITNCTSSGRVSVSGAGTIAGGLVGYNSGAIENSSNMATVTAGGIDSRIGGLAGLNTSDGSISSSANRGAVTVSGNGSMAGGLVGENAGSIADAYNAAAVTSQGAGSKTGGLSGLNSGRLVSTYNTGAVSSEADNTDVGGLAGENGGMITGSYSNAVVTATAAATNNRIGGLAGTNNNSGAINGSYAVGMVTAQGGNSAVGGLVGRNAGSVANAYSMVVTGGSGTDSRVGGLAGENSGAIDHVFSVGATTGDDCTGGLVGANSGAVTNALWATDTSGQAAGFGSGAVDNIQGVTFANMLQNADYTGWDTTVWGIADGLLPYLKWQYSVTPSLAFTGTVQGGSGQTVKIVQAGKDVGQAIAFGRDGFFYGVNTQGQTLNGNILMAYVAGDPDFKATSVYNYGSNCNLIKDTLNVDFSGGAPQDGVFSELGSLKRSLTTEDIIYTYDSSTTGIGVNGSFILNTPGDFWINDNYNTNKQGQSALLDEQITASGDITINAGGNIVLRHGFTNDTVLTSLNGNVTLSAGTGFVNASGPNAIECAGRWLIYAPDQMVSAANKELYFYAPLYIDPAYYSKVIAYTEPGSDELFLDVGGGLASDFTLWGYTPGQIIPATGNGFIFTAASPTQRALTSGQLQRKEAVVTAQSGNTPFLALSGSAPEQSTEEPLPFLTVVDGGLTI